jgi:flagellar basal-body rod protein FlgC
MSLFNTFLVAGSAMTAQSMRLNAVASNLANADSVVSSDGKPYRAKQVVFAATPMGNAAAQGVRVKQVVEDSSPGRLVYDPRNPAADDKRLRRDAQCERGRRDDQHDLGGALLSDQR